MKKKNDLKRLRKTVKKNQDAKRFEHTLGVEFTAAALAMRYNESIHDARAAGILHDCAKCMSDEKRLAICDKHGIAVTDIERRNPFLLHGKAGAYLAEKKYGVKDQNIFNAIQFHTTGREAMSTLEKIIFVADYIEPGRRRVPGLSEIRKLAFIDLDDAVLQILENTLDYLRNSGGEIDPMTEVTCNYYREKARRE